MKSSYSVTHEEISQRARDIWEQAGRPEGQETDHWLRAESELQTERGQAESFAKGNGTMRSSRETNRAKTATN